MVTKNIGILKKIPCLVTKQVWQEKKKVERKTNWKSYNKWTTIDDKLASFAHNV